MVNGKVVAAIILSVLIIAGVYFFVSVGNVQESGNSIKSIGTGSSVMQNEKIIEMTSNGFSPSTLTISVGDTVTFVNKGSDEHWPASAMHPTHTVYPGSNIEKCGTSEESTIFDACKGISPGESYKFTFYEKGTWGYHDHINAGLFGKIIVE
ncbi:MAG: plastocyanin/azurin family copper-binding protein [Nanoarchaeota archaeon]